jgi:hypothetical protein
VSRYRPFLDIASRRARIVVALLSSAGRRSANPTIEKMAGLGRLTDEPVAEIVQCGELRP